MKKKIPYSIIQIHLFLFIRYLLLKLRFCISSKHHHTIFRKSLPILFTQYSYCVECRIHRDSAVILKLQNLLTFSWHCSVTEVFSLRTTLSSPSLSITKWPLDIPHTTPRGMTTSFLLPSPLFDYHPRSPSVLEQKPPSLHIVLNSNSPLKI